MQAPGELARWLEQLRTGSPHFAVCSNIIEFAVSTLHLSPSTCGSLNIPSWSRSIPTWYGYTWSRHCGRSWSGFPWSWWSSSSTSPLFAFAAKVVYVVGVVLFYVVGVILFYVDGVVLFYVVCLVSVSYVACVAWVPAFVFVVYLAPLVDVLAEIRVHYLDQGLACDISSFLLIEIYNNPFN